MSEDCDRCQEERLQRKPKESTQAPEVPSIVHEVLSAPGQPLDPATREFFERRLGHDFSRVRVHSNSAAAESAAAVDAVAYTVGEHIAFQAGRYAPHSREGQWLLAHELAHVLQQSEAQTEVRALDDAGTETAEAGDGETASAVQARLEIGTPGDQFELEADRIADRIVSRAAKPIGTAVADQEREVEVAAGASGPGSRLQRAGPTTLPAGTKPTGVIFSTGEFGVHVPPCGIGNVTASTVPANIPGIAWSLNDGTAQVDANSSISSVGEITLGSNQSAGTIKVTAATAIGAIDFAWASLPLHSHPEGISSTFKVGPPAEPKIYYGAVFDHHFTSADNNIASLEGVPVGEEFSDVPNPKGIQHFVPMPFDQGMFELKTANLTENATNNWFLSNGSLGGTNDTVSIKREGINVGRFLASASNPKPANTLPAGFSVKQGLFWYCRQGAAGSRWTKFVSMDHVRTLRLDPADPGVVQFVVSDNGLEHVDDYTGAPAIIHAHAAPNPIPASAPSQPGASATPPSTTTISADSAPNPLPSGHQLKFSILGNALGCLVDKTTGVFTAGTQAGTVKVRISDSVATNPNFDDVEVRIPPNCPTRVQFSTGNYPVHVPPCGGSITASTVPADIPGITWALSAGTAKLDAATNINNNGEITLGPNQIGGTVRVTAEQPSAEGGDACSKSADLRLSSHPFEIISTFVAGAPPSPADYGAVFDHHFKSADGKTSSLDEVPVSEVLSNLPNPDRSTPVIPTPFGDVALKPRGLTPGAAWLITDGSLGGEHDPITIERARINVGKFLKSASNPAPDSLPASFKVTQGLFWFCRQAPEASGWTKIVDVDHLHTLRLDDALTGVQFAVNVNGAGSLDAYSGQPAIIKARAKPPFVRVSPPPEPGAPAATPNTTTITADWRPALVTGGHAFRFSIQGDPLGCKVNETTGVFAAGTKAGRVTVRISDSDKANANFDEAVVMIVDPSHGQPRPDPQPGQPPAGQPQPGQPNPNNPAPGGSPGPGAKQEDEN